MSREGGTEQFVLVFVDTPLDVCEQRDTKGVRLLTRTGMFLVSAADRDVRPSDAIVVLGSVGQFRATEATRLFHKRVASRVLMIGSATRGQDTIALATLHRFDVPSRAIIVIPAAAATNTEQELESVAQHARTTGYRRLILVTSRYHARRVRWIWDARFGVSPMAVVHILSPDLAKQEGIEPDDWWRWVRGWQLVAHEYLGILAFLLRHAFGLTSS